jgi:hypothetical protein
MLNGNASYKLKTEKRHTEMHMRIPHVSLFRVPAQLLCFQ